MKTSALLKWRHYVIERPFLLSVLIFFAAFLPRLAAVGRYITPDELIWVYRSINFREAIIDGRWADTLLAGHPGVITMWLGTIGTSLQLLLNPADREVYQWITQLAWLTPDNMAAFQRLSAFLTSGRIAVAIVSSLGIVLIYWLARRLTDDILAVLLVVFLLLDPFLAGLSGLLHVDGLVTTFVTLSLLSLALLFATDKKGEARRSRLVYAALSGSTAALAVLAKSPALLLLPVTAIVFFLSLWRDREVKFGDRSRKTAALGAVWLGSFLLLLFLIFPALWSSPLNVLTTGASNANRHMEEALRPTFFMGDVAFDHGPFFYPIALAWRLGPVVVIGLIILLVLFWQRERRGQLPQFSILIMLLWVAIFLAGITLAAKKFDRYALPLVPALTLLAAVGWAIWLRPAERAKKIVLAALLVVQFAYLLFVLPYPLAAYNLLLGGPISAQYVMPIGWGEGISAAGSWLAKAPEAALKQAVSGIAPSLTPFFPGETLLAEATDNTTADYVIVTANGRQVDPQGIDQTTSDLTLLEVVRYGGLDQSWIYENPHPQRDVEILRDLPQPVTFGSTMRILSDSLRSGDEEISYTVRWERLKADHLRVKLRLLDGDRQQWSQLETTLLNEVYFYPEHWQSDELPVVAYKLRLPPAIPPGVYSLELSLIDETTESQLPVEAEDGSFEGVQYSPGDVELMLPESPADVKKLNMVAVEDVSWARGSLRLLGHAELLDRVVAGGVMNVDLYWQATEPLADDLQISFQIAGESPLVLPLSRYESGLWQPGTVIQEKYRLQVPAGLDPGDVMITLKPLFADGRELDGPRYPLSDIEIQDMDRLFTLPEDIAVALDAVFTPGIRLWGMEPGDVRLNKGDTLDFSLIWQTDSETDQPVTAFVHLVDDQGHIVAQLDRWPGGLPSNIWSAGQVIIDRYELPLDPEIQPGVYQIVVGLYTAENGVRLPVSDANGRPLLDDSVRLPITVSVE